MKFASVRTALIIGVVVAVGAFLLFSIGDAGAQGTEETQTVTPTPTSGQATPTSDNSAMVAAGPNHACALDDDGAISCQGVDGDGQVSKHPNGQGFTAISVGESHSCAIDKQGYVQCWGSNEHRQSSSPNEPGFVALDSGDNYTCAMRANGDMECWGRFESVSETPTITPTPTATSTSATTVTPTPTATPTSVGTPVSTITPTVTPTPTPTSTVAAVRVHTLRELAAIEDDWSYSDPDIHIRVRAYVNFVNDDIGDLTLYMRDAGYSEYCYFDEAYRAAVTALTKGQIVTVDGTFNGYWLQDCVLTDTNLSVTPYPTPTPSATPTTTYTLRELDAIEDDWSYSDPDIRIRVRAYVNFVNNDIGNLTLYMRDAGYSEYCYFDEAYRAAVTALTKGQTVTIDGTFNGYWLRDCELVSVSGQGTGNATELSESELQALREQQEEDLANFEMRQSNGK